MDKLKQYWVGLDPKQQKRIFVGLGLVVIIAGVWFSNSEAEQPESRPLMPEVITKSTFQVHVTGAVVAPGLYSLDSGARVQDAVVAAGGFAEDALESSVNLARLISDGEQILVLSEAQVGSGAGQYLSLNRATATELEGLPGIGPATAEKIIDYRARVGSFSAVEELLEVPGIGPKLFDRIRDQLTL